MVRHRSVLLILAAGLLTFGIVFSFLQFSPSRAEPSEQTEPTPAASVAAYPVATDSLAPQIDAGDEAIGVPSAGSEALLRAVQRGDRLDIVASLVSPRDGQPLTAVVARGATVLRPLGNGDPLIVEVPAPDALMLAHLIMNGTHLGYVLWPASGSPVAATPPALDDRTVRDALGLSSSATTIPTVAPSVGVTPTARAGAESGFLYQVQANDTWDSIAATFGIPTDQLRQWNEATSAGDPVPGSLIFIPRPAGARVP